MVQSGAPVYDSEVGANYFNFTVVYGAQITIVFMGFINLIKITFGELWSYDTVVYGTYNINKQNVTVGTTSYR